MGGWIAKAGIPPLLTLVVAFVMLMLSIKYLSQTLSAMLIGQSRDRMQKYLFYRPGRSFFWGALFTAGVQ